MVFNLAFYLLGFGNFVVSTFKTNDTLGGALGDTLRDTLGISPLNLALFVFFS